MPVYNPTKAVRDYSTTGGHLPGDEVVEGASKTVTRKWQGYPPENLKVVGKPDCENDPQLGSLHSTLTAKFEELAKDTETHLASMAVSFIEQPQYRLAGDCVEVSKTGRSTGARESRRPLS